MFNNVAIDVFIGLIAIFLLYSLLASILMESLAKYLALRARINVLAIFKILDDSQFTTTSIFQRFFNSINPGTFFNMLKDRPFTALFYAHPNIKNLGKNDLYRKPSAISSELFSDTLVQILRGDTYTGQQNQIDLIKTNLNIGNAAREGKLVLPAWYTDNSNTHKPIPTASTEITVSPQTMQQLKQLLFDSHSDIEVFKKGIVTLYNEMMERAIGWYTKQTRLLLLIIGFCLAVAFNVDTIQIAGKLSTDKTARDKMIEFAGRLKDDPTIKDAVKGLGNGSDTSANAAVKKAFQKVNANISEANAIAISGERTWSCFFGWLITAVAISLGAPFWFDLLGKIMSIRQAGNTKTTEAAPTKTNPSPDAIG